MRVALILGVWLVACVASLYWFMGGQLRWFDPAGVLEQHASDPNFDKLLVAAVHDRLQVEASGGSVVHIQDPGCHCNWRAQSHIDDITEQARQQGLQVAYLSLQHTDELKRWVPATPAIILLDSQGELAYIGPYAAGAFCSASSSFVESLLPQLVGTSSSGGWVNTQSRGCYCPTTA